jgi:uncharacterized protein YkwD
MAKAVLCMVFVRRAGFKRIIAVSIAGLFIALSGPMFANEPAAAAGRSRYSFHKAEKCMMRKINKRRANQGRGRLSWDRQLGYVARKHARRMARHRTIFHDNALGSKVTRWRALAQNVGTGRRCKGLFKAFMRSSPHRHNIMGHYRHVGVGSSTKGGRLYVMHVFQSRRNPGNVYNYP